MELVCEYRKIHMKRGLLPDKLATYLDKVGRKLAEQQVVKVGRGSGKSFPTVSYLGDSISSLPASDGAIRGISAGYGYFDEELLQTAAMERLNRERDEFFQRHMAIRLQEASRNGNVYPVYALESPAE